MKAGKKKRAVAVFVKQAILDKIATMERDKKILEHQLYASQRFPCKAFRILFPQAKVMDAEDMDAADLAFILDAISDLRKVAEVHDGKNAPRSSTKYVPPEKTA